MTRPRTQQEIEAGARAIYQNRSQTRWAWEELEPKQREHFLAVAQDTITAADAAAAPAVGVTVDAAMVKRLRMALDGVEPNLYGNVAQRSWWDLRDAVRALLTAQPEPGTHGNGCPACDGKGWVEEKCLVCCGDGFDDDDEPGTHDAGQATEGGE